ncbi:MAG: hypothetical protein H0V01_00540 [Bacteroidetes bacterium]|nr:hypothetical protein [Bacteroidota bacterium]HET6245636.1 hypothetical protein [Bacteroidia bacterium]
MKTTLTFKKSIIVLLFALPLSVFAQCNSFMKLKCNPILKPYLSSGQVFNSTLLSEDKAKLLLTFYEGMNYRIVVCSQPELGNVQMRLKDGKNKIVFTGSVQESNFWDLKVDATQVMTIEVLTPVLENTESMVKSGCVSLMVGFKPY